MQVQINGVERELLRKISITDYLVEIGIKPEHVVIELNGEILERISWGSRLLKEKDILEIIKFVGGG